MSQETHHAGAFDKLFHHKSHEEHHDEEHSTHPGDHGDPSGVTRPQHEGGLKRFENDFKKDENKFKNYLAKDEELEEGKTYGGLM